MVRFEYPFEHFVEFTGYEKRWSFTLDEVIFYESDFEILAGFGPASSSANFSDFAIKYTNFDL